MYSTPIRSKHNGKVCEGFDLASIEVQDVEEVEQPHHEE